MVSSSLTLRYFFCFFYLVCKLLKGLFAATLSVSELDELSLWIIEHTSEISSNVSINLYLRPCSIAVYGKFYLCCLYHLRLFSGLLMVKICSVNYILYFWRDKIHKHCLYWSVFSTDIKGKIIFSYLLLFKPFLVVSKLNELNQ